MARLPRLALSGLPHLLLLRGLNHQPLAVDDQDRADCLEALRIASSAQRLAVHGYLLRDDCLRLLATPAQPGSLGRAVQDFGRRYVTRFNRRHGRRGPLWDGRFRATVVQPGAQALQALIFVETDADRAGQVEQGESYPWSSAGAHIGAKADPLVDRLDEYWRLGNTPFDREMAYAGLLAEGLPPAQARRLDDACQKGWPVGDEAFLAHLTEHTDRPLPPRRPGRPAKVVT